MKLEVELKGALPSKVLDYWNDQQLAAVFATGVNYSKYHQEGNMDPWLTAENAVNDFNYIQAQLRPAGIDANGILTKKIFEGFHDSFDVSAVVAAFQRELKTRELREDALKALPPLETLRSSDDKFKVRLRTFRDVLMRHSYVPQPQSTNPDLYRKLQSHNPQSRNEPIFIVRLPSIIPPPR